MSILPVRSKIAEGQTLKISPFKEVIKPTAPHKHAGYFELIVLADGAGEHVIDGTVYEITPPVIFFLKPGQTHCWDLTRIPKGYVLLFKEDLLNTAEMATVYRMATQIRLTGDGGYLPLFGALNEEYERGAADTVLAGYLKLLLHKTALLAEQGPSSPAHVLFYEFKKLLHTQGANLQQVRQYADELGISVKRLNQLCREATGKTPSAMLNERLLLEAKTLLTSTDRSIKEVAHALRFTDTSHFVKFFKTATNLTPGAYREILAAKA